MAERRAGRTLAPFLELFALNGFVVVQPLLDAMGRSPELFVLRRASRVDIVLLAVGLVMAPPLLLWGLERLADAVAGRRAGALLHRAIVTLLLAFLAIQILKDLTPARDTALVLAAVAAAVVVSFAAARFDAIKTWLRYLAFAPVVFAVLFLAVSPASKLVVQPAAAGAAGVLVGEDGPPVVMLVLDELPLMSLLDDEGRIDADLYPNFARLAADSTWFRNTTAVNGYTSQGVPAMLTGRFPRGRAPVAVENPSNLFTLLGRAYDVVGYEAVTALCPATVCEQGPSVGPTGSRAVWSDALRAWRDVVSLDDNDGAVTESIFEASDEDRTARREAAVEAASAAMKVNQPGRFTQFLAELDGDRDRTFWFLHLLLPHTPWRHLPAGMQYTSRSFGKEGDVWVDEPWVTVHQRQRHLLQLVYTDHLLGQVLDRLEDEGMYDEALVVVTSDHGAGFVPGSHFRKLEDENVAQLAWVPFLVKAPGQRSGEVRDNNVMTVDILPTVADALDVELPWEVDGISAYGPARDSNRKRFESAGTKSIDGDRWFPQVLRGATAELGLDPDGPDDLFRVGPHLDLLGTAVADLVDRGATEGRATVNDLAAFSDVQPLSGTVPALVTGAVEGIDAPDAVAVAVNGTVVAVSEVYGDRPLRFATLVPDAAFVPGRNRLDVLAVDPDGVLTPMRVRG